MIDLLLTLVAVGLFYDVAGVTALGFAFFSKSNKALQAESETRINYNSDLMKSLVTSRTDGVLGSSLLILGFTLQLLGFLQVQSKEAAIVGYITLLLINASYWLRFRSKIVANHCAAISAMRKANA